MKLNLAAPGRLMAGGIVCDWALPASVVFAAHIKRTAAPRRRPVVAADRVITITDDTPRMSDVIRGYGRLS